jgi:hypothetical protein
MDPGIPCRHAAETTGLGTAARHQQHQPWLAPAHPAALRRRSRASTAWTAKDWPRDGAISAQRPCQHSRRRQGHAPVLDADPLRSPALITADVRAHTGYEQAPASRSRPPQFPKSVVAAAWAARRHQIDKAFLRQMLRPRPARGLRRDDPLFTEPALPHCRSPLDRLDYQMKVLTVRDIKRWAGRKMVTDGAPVKGADKGFSRYGPCRPP